MQRPMHTMNGDSDERPSKSPRLSGSCGAAEVLEVNVGGQIYSVLRQTLELSDAVHPDSRLAAVVTGKQQGTYDNQGRLFFEGDGPLFRDVLGLLRDGSDWRPPEDRATCERLLREFRYFGLSSPELEARLAPAGASGAGSRDPRDNSEHFIMVAGGWGRKDQQPDDEVVLFSPSLATFATMPTKLSTRRHGCAGATLEGKVFVLGGCGRDEFADTSDVMAWPLHASRPFSAPPMQQVNASAATLRRHVYVMGGFGPVHFGPRGIGGPLSSIWAYSPDVNLWLEACHIPEACGLMAGSQHGSCLYLMGGTTTYLQRGGLTLGQNLRYDPRMKRVQRCAVMPHPVFGASSAVLQDRVYVIGGCTRNDSTSDDNIVSLCQVYDIRAARWDSSVSPLKVPRAMGGAAACGSKVYALFGQGAGDTFEIYDTISNLWHEHKAGVLPAGCSLEDFATAQLTLSFPAA